ncbi:MAG: tetratricopeptide repeat protein, partial [Candidatus Poribacteria bacterium]|nr:tetratricopeptide repeat protein [Candidatus Poribacteria bacterium]
MKCTNRPLIRIAFFVCLCSAIFGLPTIGVTGDDYFDYITIFSSGRIARFTEMPIRVYVSPMLRTDAYLSAIRYGMHQWESASGGIIRFSETEVNKDADIRVSWGRAGLWPIAEVTGAKAELTRLDGDRIRVEIVLVPHEPKLGEVNDAAGLRAICLHEFGHAIGLWGHSPDSRDAEFHTSSKEQPSPQDVNTLLRVYATPQNTPQHEIAIKTIKASLDGSSADARRHYLLGTITVDEGNIKEAIEHFKTALALDPTSEAARQRLIQVYQDFGYYEQAIELLNDVLADSPSHDAYNTLGVMYYRKGKIDESITAFQNSVNRNSHDLAAQHNLHQIFREKGIAALQAKNHAQADAYFRKALQFAARDASAVYRLMGDSYERRGDFSTAISYYEKALEANPVNREVQDALAQCHNNHGVKLRNTGRWDEAINAYNRAIALAPTLAVARSNLIDALLQRAKHHRELGNIDEAIDSYRELAALETSNSDAHSRLGELYL